MSDKPLPADRLTISEELFVVSMYLVYGAAALVAFGAFICVPWVVGIVFVVLAIRQASRRKHQYGPISDLHGTGHFASDQEIAASGFGGTAGLILGEKERQSVAVGGGPVLFEIVSTPTKHIAKVRTLIERYVAGGIRMPGASRSSYAVRLPATDKFAHVACYLPSGVGKTWGVVIPNLYNSDENAVIYDPSGETHKTAEYRQKIFGHTTILIDPFGVCGEARSDRLNVLDLVQPDSPGCFDYCRNLARAMVPEKVNNSQEPFWHSAAVTATEFLLYTTMRTAKPEIRNIRTLGELLSAERFHELAVGLSNHPDEALRRRAMQMASFEGRTLQSLIACLTTEHGWMDSPTFATALSESTFSVRNLYRKKKTMFIVIPGNRTLEAQPFVRLVLTAILFAAFEAGPDVRRRPVRFYLDEAATLGQLDQLMTLYTQGRKYGLRSVSFFQSLGQVAEIMGGPERVHTFRSNMSAELVKPKDFQTAKETSEWIGQMTARTASLSGQDGANTGWSNSYGNQASHSQSGGTNQSSGFTLSEQGVAVIRPEEILQLREREAIVLAAGTPPIKINIIPATEAVACGKQGGGGNHYLRSVRFWALFNALVAAPGLVLIAVGLMIAGSGQWIRPNSQSHSAAAYAPWWTATEVNHVPTAKD